jgi:hypothetical protein
MKQSELLDQLIKTCEQKGHIHIGARYYDPKISNWISTDPALGDYLPTGAQMFFPEKAFDANSLKGAGGVFNSKNLNLYHYANWNPIKLFDPDGREVISHQNRLTKQYNIQVGNSTVTLTVTMIKGDPKYVERTNEATGKIEESGFSLQKGEMMQFTAKIDGKPDNNIWSLSGKEGGSFANIKDFGKNILLLKESGLKDPIKSFFGKFLKDSPNNVNDTQEKSKKFENDTKDLNIDDKLENFQKRDEISNLPPIVAFILNYFYSLLV